MKKSKIIVNLIFMLIPYILMTLKYVSGNDGLENIGAFGLWLFGVLMLISIIYIIVDDNREKITIKNKFLMYVGRFFLIIIPIPIVYFGDMFLGSIYSVSSLLIIGMATRSKKEIK